ncbi:S41 family peptidase [uncultured Flavobacterium sp.]|uniref:S41 family peptidase n=1 Tax=uncultured Flavobacterium sp. TaxID=165435 RepID=UPI0027E0D8A7|nr:S41 family peptidase [uncultured Flavobacterium sp.]
MKKLTLLLLLLHCLSVCSQKTYTPQQMKADVDSLVQYIEETHPNPYYRYPKKKFQKDIQQLKNGLNTNLNEVDFYLAFIKIISRLDDGHTGIDIPLNSYLKTNPSLLLYEFTLSPQKPYIITGKPYTTIKNEIPKDSEIISINSISSEKIIKDIIALNTGERDEFKAEYGANSFFFYLDYLYNAKGIYNITYKLNGKKQKITVKGVPYQDYEKQRNLKQENSGNEDTKDTENYTLKLIPEKSTAIISFQIFDWDGFSEFCKQAFTEIKDKKIENLIIDIRNNLGGDSDVGDELFQFFMNQPYKQYDRVIGKNSRLIKERIRTHERNGKILTSEDLATLKKAEGIYDTIVYEEIPIRENSLRFNGKMYLLTSAQAFSSAADFAQCFSNYKRGKIIGEETGGLVVSYGDIVSHQLPNTQLPITISSKLYYNVGTKTDDWHGVIPDIKIPAGKALDEALKIIQNQ